MFSTHAILAAGLKTPEIALSKVEAETLAKATAEVAKHYPHAIDPKTIAWVNLATCMGLTYGPRVYMIRQRLDAEKRDRRARSGAGPTPAPANTNADAPTEPAFIMPGFPGGIGPVADASGM